MNALFAIDSIGKRFGSRIILKAASVWVREGRITALLGRNGCGKSTLLRVGVGLVRADQGAVHFHGKVFTRPRLPVLARLGLFYVPDRDLLSSRLTLREQLAAVEWRFGTSRRSAALELFGLEDRLDQRPAELSGGERRRADLAAAWIRSPSCLIADEPFAGIPPRDREVIGRAFRRMADEGCGILVTGHEVDQLMESADDVVWMTAGTTHGIGNPAAALEHDQFSREYLGVGRGR